MTDCWRGRVGMNWKPRTIIGEWGEEQLTGCINLSLSHSLSKEIILVRNLFSNWREVSRWAWLDSILGNLGGGTWLLFFQWLAEESKWLEWSWCGLGGSDPPPVDISLWSDASATPPAWSFPFQPPNRWMGGSYRWQQPVGSIPQPAPSLVTASTLGKTVDVMVALLLY